MKQKKLHRLLFSLLFPLWILLFNGCAFYELKKEVADFSQTYGIGGKVTNYSPHDGPVIVVLFSEKGGEAVLSDYSLLGELGHYSFLVPEGTYYVGAFEDSNNNFTYDPGEYSGYFGAPDRFTFPLLTENSTAKGVGKLDFYISKKDEVEENIEITVDATTLRKKTFVKLGIVTDLDNKIFLQENGSLGYWKPMTFLRKFGHGIYFLEPYDPSKIPILFVHGATGTPIGWKTIVKNIDRDHFQPWFYYYPSGFRLDLIGNALNNTVSELHEIYHFKNLYIFAHSMGGLVSRSFMMKNIYQDGNNYIKLFVSVSTPWNGHPATQKGVKNAPEAVPSWHDMVPDSDFIQSIFSKNIPSDIAYHLFFTVRGDYSLFMANNDGTVEISSQLDMRAQNDAERLYGYDEDHDSILTSSGFIDQFNEILNNSDAMDTLFLK